MMSNHVFDDDDDCPAPAVSAMTAAVAYQMSHTPGPLQVMPTHWAGGCGSKQIDGHNTVYLEGPRSEMCRMCSADPYTDPSVYPNARLLAAAYTSYDKHCGPRAVECAEQDLLGDLLDLLDPDALEAIANEIDCPQHSARAHSLRVIARKQRAAIAKAESTNPRSPQCSATS